TSLWPEYTFSPSPGRLHTTTRLALDASSKTTVSLQGASFEIVGERPIVHVDSAPGSGELSFLPLRHRIDRLQLSWPSLSLLWEQGGHLGWQGLAFSMRPDGNHMRQQFSADTVTLDNGWGRSTRLSGVRMSLGHPGKDETSFSAQVDRVALPSGM